MDDKKKIYSQADVDRLLAAVRAEYEATLLSQRERIDELKKSLDAAERKITAHAGQKELVYKAITAALKKADDIERVSLIKYNQEIAQLRSFHEKWLRYFNGIIEAYPLDDNLIAAGRVNRKISDILERSGDIDAQYETERERLKTSLESDDDTDIRAEVSAHAGKDDDYADRSPAGFSIAEALHPKDDLRDIMRELGVIIDDEE